MASETCQLKVICLEKLATSSYKEEAEIYIIKYIIKSECKRNYDVFLNRPTSFPLCFSHVKAIFQSFFSQVSSVGLRRICLCAKIHSFVHCL